MALWPFSRSRTFLDPDDEDWQLATWAWLLARLGTDNLKRAPLVTTKREFFPPSDTTGHARAEHILRSVQRLAGMSDWPCKLVALPERPRTRVSELGMVKIDKGHMPLGTFSQSGNSAIIAYDPGTVSSPAILVATLAHELAHYLLHSIADLPPGQELMEEFATDLTTVYLGFGLFGANQAFNFSQFRDIYSQGWQTSGAGYLRERDWALALAIFCALRGEDAAALKPWLKDYLFKDVQSAARYLSKNPQVLAKIEEHRQHYAANTNLARPV
ncbi:MAG: hypothetical protein ISS15_20480 [Alphaproteobacteria bacterium]|nr:hypothetical protein [Alphaproteobacteria bacterium]MBL6939586.1 hypothetical protein [Alphaproteobacteria bacterium]MBL7100041.1 hypothetical protein [Alphaproteobacteria bacterium]